MNSASILSCGQCETTNKRIKSIWKRINGKPGERKSFSFNFRFISYGINVINSDFSGSFTTLVVFHSIQLAKYLWYKQQVVFCPMCQFN